MRHGRTCDRRILAGALSLVLIGAALVVANITRSLQDGYAESEAAPHNTPLLYGANMGLFNDNDQIVTNAATQQLLKQQGMAIIRMPFRPGLPDAVELRALQAIKNIGAAPLVIMHGATDANALQDDLHLISLAQSVFGSSTVYVEYGNEEDLAGVNVSRYTASWNAVVPKLKAVASTYKFIGPVTFQYNPRYVATFDEYASPRPDFNSWHEYVCNANQPDSYCMSHIANWSTHVALTNQAVQGAIGTTLPIMITEWNLDPQQDARYSNATFMRQWTQAALNVMVANSAKGVVAAMQYCITNNQGFNLIDGNNLPTAQGQTLFGALAKARRASGNTAPAYSIVTASATSSTARAGAETTASTSAPPATTLSSVPLAPRAPGNWESYGSQITSLQTMNVGSSVCLQCG